MKTFAAVLCALLATVGVAFAHGAAGGGPVAAPGGAPVMVPIGSGFPTQSGFPAFSRAQPDRTVTTDRRHKTHVPRSTFYYPYYGDICRPFIYVPTIYQRYEVEGGAPCDVQTQNGMLALPPAFLW